MKNPEEAWGKLLLLKDSLFLFDVEEKNYLIDKNSSRFSEINEDVKKVVSSLVHGISFDKMKEEYLQTNTNDNLTEILNELFTLYSNGFLAVEDRLSKVKENRGRFVSTLCLIMAADCNLRCRYCFAKGGSYDLKRNKMSHSVAQEAINFLINNSGRIKNLSVSFFGGEPLLNFKEIKNTVQYADEIGSRQGKVFNYSITTNGILLNPEIMDFIVEHNFSIIVSIDGPKEVNDLYRVFPNGSGSYDVVEKKLREFVERYPHIINNITLRGTYTTQTSDIAESLYYLRSLGFNKISIETVTTDDKDFEINDHNIANVFKEYDKVAARYLESLKNNDNFSFFHLHQLFFQVAEGTQRVTQCGAGIGYLAIDPEGIIYPCHRLVGDERYKMGNVFDNALDPKVQTLFRHSNANSKKDCHNCWAKYICGGGCHATAIQFNNDILVPYQIECELMKHRIKLGAYIYSKLDY